MGSDKRRNVRRSLAYPGLINVGDGSPLRQCTLFDVSESGAQIVVPAPDELPEEFCLILGFVGAAQRHCRVAWRSDKRIGVKFQKEPKDAISQPADRRNAVTGQ